MKSTSVFEEFCWDVLHSSEQWWDRWPSDCHPKWKGDGGCLGGRLLVSVTNKAHVSIVLQRMVELTGNCRMARDQCWRAVLSIPEGNRCVATEVVHWFGFNVKTMMLIWIVTMENHKFLELRYFTNPTPLTEGEARPDSRRYLLHRPASTQSPYESTWEACWLTGILFQGAKGQKSEQQAAFPHHTIMKILEDATDRT